jgi:hypothetical protein
MGYTRRWRWTTLWEHVIKMKKIIFSVIILLFAQIGLAETTFKDLKNNRQTSYLDFILLKLESKLIQRHGIMRTQPVALRVQYQTIVTQVDFEEKDSKIIVSIMGVMDKARYTKKKYKPKITDCNVLRNLLVYGKYGYNLIFQKRNKFLTNADMEEIFVSTFLNNLSLSEKEKDYLTKNTFIKVQVIDPVHGNNISCEGDITQDLN